METLTQPFRIGSSGNLLYMIRKKKKATTKHTPKLQHNCYWFHGQKGVLENQGELLVQELLYRSSREDLLVLTRQKVTGHRSRASTSNFRRCMHLAC